MKKILASLLLLALATTMHAQTLLKGDMNKDGKLTLADLTALISAVNDNSLIEAINVYEVENSTVIGTWYAADGTTLVFREDGTTNYPGGATYEFMPILGRMLVYDTSGTVVRTLTFKKVTPEYLLEESTINGALTYYTNSAYVVANLTLNRTSLSLRTGGTFPLQVTATPLTALNSSVEWTSSDESVATVNASGLVTAISGGTCTITCTAKDGGGASATCELTVIQLVTGITLNQPTISLNVGTTSQLSATVQPANASNNGVTWTSSDEGVATVDADGLVTAVSRGTCTITCTAKDGSGVVATCEVTANQLVTNISLSQSTLSLNSGSTAQLSATVLPANANDMGVTWTSSDEDVATVDADGLVTAIAGGSCTITATAADGSGVEATCEVTVNQLVTSITLSHTTLALQPEEYQKLTATVLPSNASNKGVTWTSSDESVAEVTSNGFVSAIGLGTCTITCTAKDASGVSATCEVTVMLQPVTDITLSASAVNMRIDETHQLTATVLPSDANNPNVVWTSSDETVATVDQTGLVTSIAEGTCTITVIATDGSGVSATCLMTVIVDNSGSIDGRDYVDLGLPSGTLWATCNIGASKPEYYGDYFAWGVTRGYNSGMTEFGWSTYKWCKGSGSTLTKYCNDSSRGYNGFTDTLTELEPEDDAAYVNWGSAWRMPSKAQFDELINSSYTTTIWTTQNGVNGYKITSKNNGNSLFLPASGSFAGNTSLSGKYGYYWSRTLVTSYPGDAYRLYFGSGDIYMDYYYRYYGFSVRPVRSPQ